MKATLSIAVMALLGHISAAEVMQVPTADALIQTGAHHHHRKVIGKDKKKKLRDPEIHGYMNNDDDKTAYDPNVADAPEDMPRVGNDDQMKHHKKRHHHGKKHPKFVQINNKAKFEHEHDTDDVVEEFSDEVKVQTKFDHEKDTDDVVEEFSDMVEEQ